MAYVKQICEGYSKKSLMGNWYEERQYPQQAFRSKQQKQARDKDQGITCFDNTGFQRALPRLSRRSKWETTSRIVLDDGIKQQKTIMKEEYPNGQQQHSTKPITRPFDRNLDGVKGTTVHPNSQLKLNQKKYNVLDQKTVDQLTKQRYVHNYGSDFRSTLISHPRNEKYSNYTSTYKGSYASDNANRANRTVSDFNKTRKQAGNFNDVPEDAVKPITNMTGELKKETGDKKEVTEVQRSWVPQREKAISLSTGRTATDFKKANIPSNDIQTSLNVNIGAYNVHPKNIPDNFFRHIKQDVTIQPNNTFCSRP